MEWHDLLKTAGLKTGAAPVTRRRGEVGNIYLINRPDSI